MVKINALGLTTEEWNEKYNIPEYVSLKCNVDIEEMSKTLFDLVFIDRAVSHNELEILQKKSTKAYAVFYTEIVTRSENFKKFIECRKAKLLPKYQLQEFFDNRIRDYFSGSYGEKSQLLHLCISKDFRGKIQWRGNCSVDLEGDFGNSYKQIAFWKYNVLMDKGQILDLFFEHNKSDQVGIQLSVSLYEEGKKDCLLKKWTFDENDLKDTIRLENEVNRGFLFVSIKAKGTGKLGIIGFHTRFSRREVGAFLPGGVISRTLKGEELFAYFDPGDMIPPLNIYFSGYKTKEGFEGYHMMKGMGCPFLLIAEPRYEGGGFYIGDDEYEALVRDTISEYIKKLGFENNEVIMSGISMGTTGALYYGADIRPHAIIVGKPLISLGNIAYNEQMFRPGGFPTSVDILLNTTGKTDEEAVDKLNLKIWDKLKNANYEKTKFIVSYMIEDDYDTGAYNKLIDELSSTGVHIYGKGLHGRHNDDTNGIVYWFSARFKSVLRDDFGRDI